MGLGLGLGIWWPTQTSIIPGLLKALCARATYCENKLCTTATLEEIAAVRYTAPPLPVYTDNLVASYSFDTDFSDYTGNNNLTASGDATAGVEIGKVDKCADFDGSGDYALAVDSDDFSMTNGTNDLPFTVSLWVKLDVIPTVNKTIIGKEQSGSNREWVVLYSPYTINGFQFTIRNADGSEYINLIDNTITYQTNTWYHFTFTYNGSELGSGLKCYRDGVLQSLTPVVVNYNGMTNTASPLTIGGLSNAKWTDGKLDEIHVWKNRELTSAEVLEIYNTENAGNSIL